MSSIFVTVEAITEKKNALKRQQDQLVANLNAVQGALQTLEELLTAAKTGPDPAPGP